MKELAEALPWVAFWLVIGLFVWLDHKQFMAGYTAYIWEHTTPEEHRLREATIRAAELKANITEGH